MSDDDYENLLSAERNADATDALWGEWWSAIHDQAEKLVEQGQFKTIDEAWEKAEAIYISTFDEAGNVINEMSQD